LLTLKKTNSNENLAISNLEAKDNSSHSNQSKADSTLNNTTMIGRSIKRHKTKVVPIILNMDSPKVSNYRKVNFDSPASAHTDSPDEEDTFGGRVRLTSLKRKNKVVPLDSFINDSERKLNEDSTIALNYKFSLVSSPKSECLAKISDEQC